MFRLAAALGLALFAAAGAYFAAPWLGEYPAEVLVEVPSNSTVFVVPLTDDGANQQTLSLDQLFEMGVDAQQVTIPRRKVATGWMPWDYRLVPTQKLLVIDRHPVVREWTAPHTTGTSATNESLAAETKDGVKLFVGLTVSARVSPSEAHVFLYHFGSRPLAEVMDTNIRGFCKTTLTVLMKDYPLDDARGKKDVIFKQLYEQTEAEYKKLGIHVDYVGLDGGYTYQNPAIQTSIDAGQIEALKSAVALNAKLAQDERNKITLATADMQKRSAELLLSNKESVEFDNEISLILKKAEAIRAMAKKFAAGGGRLPQVILPSGDAGKQAQPLMLQLDGK